MVRTTLYTKEEFFSEWDSAAQEFKKNPNNVLTKGMIESVLISNDLPQEFINICFSPMIEYWEGKKMEEIDEEIIEEYAQEIFVRACDQGIAISE